MSTTNQIRAIGACLIMALAAGAGSAGEQVGAKSAGTWSPGNFAQINTGCAQTWVCTSPAVMHGPDTSVVTTESKIAFGACNTAGGDIEGCNSCSSSKPTAACEYWLEKKN